MYHGKWLEWIKILNLESWILASHKYRQVSINHSDLDIGQVNQSPWPGYRSRPCHRVSPLWRHPGSSRNVTRVTGTRRDGRVFAPLHTASLKERARNEGAGFRFSITQRSVLLRCDWSSDTRAPSLWLVESRAPCTRYDRPLAVNGWYRWCVSSTAHQVVFVTLV